MLRSASALSLVGSPAVAMASRTNSEIVRLTTSSRGSIPSSRSAISSSSFAVSRIRPTFGGRDRDAHLMGASGHCPRRSASTAPGWLALCSSSRLPRFLDGPISLGDPPLQGGQRLAHGLAGLALEHHPTSSRARTTNPCPSSTPISIRPWVLTQRATAGNASSNSWGTVMIGTSRPIRLAFSFLTYSSAASSQRGSSSWVSTSILSCLRWGINSCHCGLSRSRILAGRRVPITQGRSIALANKSARSLTVGACFTRQEGEVEVLKPGQHHAEPEFAVTPCIPAPDRDWLDVGLPDLLVLGRRFRRLFTKAEPLPRVSLSWDSVHRLVIPIQEWSALDCHDNRPSNRLILKPCGCFPACPSRTGKRGSPRHRGNPRPPRAGSPCFRRSRRRT